MTEKKIIETTMTIMSSVVLYKRMLRVELPMQINRLTDLKKENALEEKIEEVLDKIYYTDVQLKHVIPIFYFKGNIRINFEFFEDTKLIVFSVLKCSKNQDGTENISGTFHRHQISSFRTNTLENLIEDCLYTAMSLMNTSEAPIWKIKVNSEGAEEQAI